jgi:mRNA-degrading endonuclease YafQ of YafQ-DinJ toxin-antitoxin module
MKFKYKKSFKKSYKKLNPKIQWKVDIKIKLFSKNPFLEELNNHSLKWKLLWKRSINITGDFRAIFKELSNWKYEFIEFVEIWTHSELY